MRVTSRPHRTRWDDERGSTLLMVALALVALMGMLVLAVDIGGLLVKRRGMVNANDSAALAAAGSFARGEAQVLVNEGPAILKADAYAQDNVSDALRDEFQTTPGLPGSECLPETCGSVMVRYHGMQELFFAPVLGTDDETSVEGTATAIWGPAGSATPQPIMVRFDWMLTECDEPVPNDNPPTVCNFWLDDTEVGDAEWSFLNLTSDPLDPNWGWDVPPDKREPGCTNVSSSDVDGWINGSIPVDALPLNYPDPTYVCAVTGKSANHLPDLVDLIGSYRVFPVNDPDGQVDKDGNPCPPPCTPDKYDIVGFNILRIDDVLQGDTDGAVGTGGLVTCTGRTGNVAFTHTGQVFNIDSLNSSGGKSRCPAGSHPDAIDALSLVVKKGGTTYVPGIDYQFTPGPTSNDITWLAAPQTDVTITFDWASAGACGIRDRNANAVCLVTSWQGYRVGGHAPGGGADFGLRAIALSD